MALQSRPAPTSTNAIHRAQLVQWLETWAKQHAKECLDCSTPGEARLDIRLGQGRQLFLMASEQEDWVDILFTGSLHSIETQFRHGGPAQLLTWLEEGGEQSLLQARFVPKWNAFAVGMCIPLGDWPQIETFCLPLIDVAIAYIARLVVCQEEANCLDGLESLSANSLRKRFLAETAGRFQPARQGSRKSD